MILKNQNLAKLSFAMVWICAWSAIQAQNPFVTDIYTADPTARVFDGKLYVYPSHDVDTCQENEGDNGFCMPDYHVFSTDEKLHNWTDHGVIVSQNTVPWVQNNSYGMWAPDCVEKNGTYYFYFPGKPANENIFRRIGVATASSPTGPFTALNTSIRGIQGIDPNVLVDDDGQSYLYFGSGRNVGSLKVVRLKNNMIEIDGNPITVDQDVPDGYREGSFAFKRGDTYYFTFARVTANNYEIEYATSSSPLGPFTYKGAIMGNIGNGTNHHSVVYYKNQWYLFYHFWSLSGNNRLRSIRADKLFFNQDGSIQTVSPTLRGIGIPKAGDIIQVDRYSEINNARVNAVQGNEPKGFQVDFIQNNSWVKFNDVDFGAGNLTTISARVASASQGGTIEVREGSNTGRILATIPVTNTGGWNTYKTETADFTEVTSGIKDLVLVCKGTSTYLFNINWITFESDDVLNVADRNIQSTFRMYPNPAKDLLKIDNLKQGETYTYNVIDLKGSQLLQGKLSPTNHSIPVDQLGSGLYILKINDDVFKKFLKE